jgi:hypothetical protein
MSRLILGLLLLLAGARAHADPLEAKASHFRQVLLERHFSPEGLVLYRMNLETAARDIETGRYPNLADTPTFTGQLAAGACTRAGYEQGAGRDQALEDAERALSGLGFLMSVTGVRGLMARGVRRRTQPDVETLRGKRFDGKGRFVDYVWRGDVSMDQYANGLLPAVAACRPYFPERTQRLVTDAAAHLLEHDMRLVDPDGQRTRFGDLSHRSGFGFNSIAQLTGYAIFASAAELDPDPRWAKQRDQLRDRYRVLARSRRTNLRVLGITNYSNDLMAWNLYRVLLPLAQRTQDPGLPDLRHGMLRTWLRVRADRNPYFTLVLCKVEPPSCEPGSLQDVRAQLERFRPDKRKLPLDPALATLPRSWLPGRKFRRQARELVPIELRPASSFEWKSNPYRVDAYVRPETEYTGLDYLAAYWLYRDLERR